MALEFENAFRPTRFGTITACVIRYGKAVITSVDRYITRPREDGGHREPITNSQSASITVDVYDRVETNSVQYTNFRTGSHDIGNNNDYKIVQTGQDYNKVKRLNNNVDDAIEFKWTNDGYDTDLDDTNSYARNVCVAFIRFRSMRYKNVKGMFWNNNSFDDR